MLFTARDTCHKCKTIPTLTIRIFTVHVCQKERVVNVYANQKKPQQNQYQQPNQSYIKQSISRYTTNPSSQQNYQTENFRRQTNPPQNITSPIISSQLNPQQSQTNYQNQIDDDKHSIISTHSFQQYGLNINIVTKPSVSKNFKNDFEPKIIQNQQKIPHKSNPYKQNQNKDEYLFDKPMNIVKNIYNTSNQKNIKKNYTQTIKDDDYETQSLQFNRSERNEFSKNINQQFRFQDFKFDKNVPQVKTQAQSIQPQTFLKNYTEKQNQKSLQDLNTKKIQKQKEEKKVDKNLVKEILFEGGRFLGQIFDGNINGRGVIYDNQNKVQYEGGFKDGNFDGYGKLYNHNSEYLNLDCSQDLAMAELSWVFYEGLFQNNLKQGVGYLHFSNKDTFCGEFKMDKANGFGVYTSQNKKVCGIWQQNTLVEKINQVIDINKFFNKYKEFSKKLQIKFLQQMDNLEIWNIKLCSLLEEITEEQVQSLEDLSDGYLMPNILNKIDPDFFVIDEKITNWTHVKILVEKYLKSQGIDENLDIDVESIHLKDIKALVAATLQIVSIIAVFNQNEWKKIDFYLNQQKEFEIIQVIKGMIANITEVLQDNEVIVRHGNANKDIVKILKDLEQKESLLQQNEQELLTKTNIIMELQQKVDQINRDYKRKKEEYEQMIKQKNETIQNLENQYYDKSNQSDYKQLQEKIQILEAEKHENLEKIVYLQGIIEEKTSEIEKLDVYMKIHEQSQQDLEEAKKQRDYYKEKLSQLKKDIEIENSNLRILKNADVKVEDLRQQLLSQMQKNKALASQNKSLITEQKSLMKRLEQTGETVDLIRRHSARTMLDAKSINSNRSIFQNEIFEDEKRLNKKILEYQQRISESIRGKNYDEKQHKQLQSQLRALEIQKQQLLDDNMKMKQQSTALLSDQQVSIDQLPSNYKSLNRNETLQNFFDHQETLEEQKNKEEKVLSNIVLKNNADCDYEFEELMYTIAWNYAQQNLMNKRCLKERSMFKLFALNDLLNS